MEKILVTTDFSNNSKAGIRFAMKLASQSPCELVFFHVIEITKPTSWNDNHFKTFAAQKTSEFTEKLTNFVAAQSEESGLPMGNYTYMVGMSMNADELIIKTAKKIKAGFICMSTHGAGKLQKLFGTNASTLVTTSPIPVIVVPKGYKIQPITTLFYASDLASLGQELKTLQQFAAPLKARVDVYHYDYLLHVEENKKKLEKKVAKYQTPDITFNLKRQEIEYPLSQHLRTDIEKAKPSMVVLFTKQNRKWFDRLFLPSETEQMAFNSKVPLLTFRKK